MIHIGIGNIEKYLEKFAPFDYFPKTHQKDAGTGKGISRFEFEYISLCLVCLNLK